MPDILRLHTRGSPSELHCHTLTWHSSTNSTQNIMALPVFLRHSPLQSLSTYISPAFHFGDLEQKFLRMWSLSGSSRYIRTFCYILHVTHIDIYNKKHVSQRNVLYMYVCICVCTIYVVVFFPIILWVPRAEIISNYFIQWMKQLIQSHRSFIFILIVSTIKPQFFCPQIYHLSHLSDLYLFKQINNQAKVETFHQLSVVHNTTV